MKMIFTGEHPQAQPDPFIFQAEGKYFLYTTGLAGVEGYVSDVPEGAWRYLGKVLCEEGMHEFWAPCVIWRDGTYFMYYSSFPEGERDTHLQSLKVAVSQSPYGPFRYAATVVKAFAIDPHVVKSGSEYYLFYATNAYHAPRAGTYIAVDRLKDMVTAEGAPVHAIDPTLEEEIFQRDRFHKGQHWHTVEGPFYFRRGDDHFLMYSGSCYQNEHYFVGYAHAHSKENDLRKVAFIKQPAPDVYAPLLQSDAAEEGRGHNSVLVTGEDFFIVYHARDRGERGEGDLRTARIAPMRVDGKTLSVRGSYVT